ncbi:MAG: ATP-grasp domain-containing protein [Corallococcus sp.]|nr:ATP-grasp domain-containing protein [Corallococcus sp.]MCM1359224.1 ATP-grasp domain-containing protein [Corallococcus sp.]MCM1394615.1 ATP-grasp domain-containing protein [Corallococcus sp.]
MNILIAYGGKSCEHDISVITACLAKGYFDGNVISAYFTKENVCYFVPNNLTPTGHKDLVCKQQLSFLFGRKQVAVIQKNKIKKIFDVDVVVNCCHGNCGEDGTVAALCKMSNLPVVGCDVIASAVTMDKIVTKQALTYENFCVLPGVEIVGEFVEKDIENIENLGYPVVVKPSTLGSSIGVALCRDRLELEKGLNAALRYDKRVLCEKGLSDFYELNCAAMRTKNGVEISVVERPFATHDILTFADKYRRGEKCGERSREVNSELSIDVKKLTAEIYEKLGLQGVVRIDYMVDNVSGALYVNEINSIPGSLSYGLWQNKYTPKQFGRLLTDQAVSDFAEQEKLNRKYVSDVLESVSICKK